MAALSIWLKTKMKKILTFLLALALIFGNVSPLLYAQEATVSSDLTSPTPEPSPEPSPAFEASPSPIVSPLPVLSPEVSSEPTILPIDSHPTPEFESSASIKLPIRVRSLTKRVYKADEKITIVLENTLNSNVQIALFNSDGVEVPTDIEMVSDYDPSVYRILPSNQLKPGRYRVKITDPEGTVTTQDFSWGVLAINPDKSIYLPNEQSLLAMAVLDETGNMVCDAQVVLKITKIPLGSETVASEEELSTQNGGITVNPECFIKDFVLKPDYEAKYQVAEAGTYQLNLTAQTVNGSYSIDDSFEVRDSVVFDIKRSSATRIFPPITYPMTMEVTANEDFSGTVREVVPGNFAVSPLSGAKNYDALESVLGASIGFDDFGINLPALTAPFDLSYPINLGFGQQLRDPLVKQKYADFGLLGHDGVDFDLPEATPVLATDDGEVVRVRDNGDYGATVVIQHSWGRSYYGHLSLITKKEGDKILRGYPLGLSGHTGLSTGPHLHFGIKPNENDMNNGYYGKINPLPYLALKPGNQDVLGAQTAPPLVEASLSESQNNQVLIWNLDLKKGDKVTLGYNYQVPNLSPQFYLLGPLQFTKTDGSLTWSEGRRWQLAIDVDGSGANTVDPTTGTVSTTGNTYTFTFDPSEAMDTGGITITVPAGWSAPQGTAGTAGYTVAAGTGNATVARVVSTADSTTGWAEDDGDACGSLGTDTSIKQEGSASISCVNTTTGPDGDDSFSFAFTSEDWSSYSEIAAWFRSDDGRASGEVQFAYDDDAPCWGTGGNAGVVEAFADFALTADTWTYVKRTLAATRTAIVAVCIGSGGDGFDNDTIWIDDVLIGPGAATFTGSGPWTITTRFLDLAATETVTVTYGSGGGASGVTNSATEAVHTFTTASRVSDISTGSYQTLTGGSPTVTLSAPAGPTTDQQMRHGNWFNASGVEQSFTF